MYKPLQIRNVVNAALGHAALLNCVIIEYHYKKLVPNEPAPLACTVPLCPSGIKIIKDLLIANVRRIIVLSFKLMKEFPDTPYL